MVDVVDSETRSRMMSGIKAGNTKPEIEVRKALHAAGYRFRLHVKGIPGRPDIVLRKHNAAIFVHGCFWHAHDCGYFRMPSTRRRFWAAKFKANQLRDAKNLAELARLDWRVLVLWECALRDKSDASRRRTFQHLFRWIESSRKSGNLEG